MPERPQKKTKVDDGEICASEEKHQHNLQPS